MEERSATHLRKAGLIGGLRCADPPYLTAFTLVLALLAAALLAYLHVRPTAPAKRSKTEDQGANEAPLEFIESEDAHGTAASDG